MISEKLKKWLQIRLRNDCLICSVNLIERYQTSVSTVSAIDICSQCRTQFTENLFCCATCAIPLNQATQKNDSSQNTAAIEMMCGACQKHLPLWSKALTSFIYEYPVDRLLIALKYQRRIDYAKCLALILSQDIELAYNFTDVNIPKPDCIVPVPLHLYRECLRGYNQANLLARELSKQLKFPLQDKLITRVRHTPQQSRLSKKQRAKNLRNAFSLNLKETIPRYVALVDDVMTTGSTAHAVTKTLLDAGVQRVDVWCIARAE